MRVVGLVMTTTSPSNIFRDMVLMSEYCQNNQTVFAMLSTVMDMFSIIERGLIPSIQWPP